MFEHPERGKSAGDQLLSLGQGKNTDAEYDIILNTSCSKFLSGGYIKTAVLQRTEY